MVALLRLRPHNSKILNFSDIFNEISFFAIHSLIILFALNDINTIFGFDPMEIMGYCCTLIIILGLLV